jgi:putative drug exporter of the RND superfamily
VALKAVLLNLLVAAAALGATVLVFQHGFGLSVLGHQRMGSIFPTVPVLAFSASFGVSTDYELFLLSGVRASRERGATHRQSVVEGLATVGSTITRAALAMAGVFFAFAFSEMLPLAMMGFSLAVAVLIDATLVRLALAPATLALAGRWNWWPGRLSK